MSADNVINIAGAALNAGEYSTLLVVLGLLISIPIIVVGALLVLAIGKTLAARQPPVASA